MLIKEKWRVYPWKSQRLKFPEEQFRLAISVTLKDIWMSSLKNYPGNNYVKIDVADSLVPLGEKIWFLNWETNPGPLD